MSIQRDPINNTNSQINHIPKCLFECLSQHQATHHTTKIHAISVELVACSKCGERVEENGNDINKERYPNKMRWIYIYIFEDARFLPNRRFCVNSDDTRSFVYAFNIMRQSALCININVWHVFLGVRLVLAGGKGLSGANTRETRRIRRHFV